MAERKVTTKAELLRLIDRAADEGWTELDLSSLGLKELPIEIGKLVNIKKLNLAFNEITYLPDEMKSLTSLEKLDLDCNRHPFFPQSLSSMVQLKIIKLDFCELLQIPSVLFKLPHLNRLNVAYNKISVIPKEIEDLRELQHLKAGGNSLTDFPEEICQIKTLRSIDLRDNKISQIPQKIGNLSRLTRLNIRRNDIAEIPVEISNLKYLNNLDIRGNQGISIPRELLGPFDWRCSPGKASAIKNYIYNLYTQKSQPLNEAKFLVVGQADIGKTSLINRLIYNSFEPNERQTDGLKVHDWEILAGANNVKLNVWDFGGQEIYHSTHQFFLTKRSLYLLVCNCRTSEEENRLEYWLKLIKSFGGNSPVIIVGNKNDEQPLDINRKALLDKYSNIKGILETSCKTGEGIEGLNKKIASEVEQLKEVYDLLPLKWFEVKEQLEAMEQDFIKYSQYERLCADLDIPEDHNQEQLIRLLHDLGLVLNYRDHPILSNTNVLNPDWVTAGIYALFSDDKLKTETKGILQPQDLSRILDTKRYPTSRHSFLIELLKEFQLGFELPNCLTEKRFLLPGLLPKEEPENTRLSSETLEFQYHYKVLPASVLSRFIVLMHEKIHEQTYWRSGVMLAYREGDETFNTARIKADPEDKKVFISISGRESTRRIFLSLIRDTFATIHSAFADPEDVTEWVPVPDHPEADPLEYKELLGLEDMGDSTVTIGKLKLRLDLRQLLDGYESREKRQRRQQGGPDNSVQVIIQQGGGDNVGGDSVGRDKIDEQNNH